MDSQGIANLIEKIDKQGLPVYSLLLVRNGYLIMESYFAPGTSLSGTVKQIQSLVGELEK